jgi:hypothetical protein
MTAFTFISRAAPAALFGLALLSACTVVVDEPGPGPGPVVCTQQYAPVCGERRGDRETFPNACVADRSGYDVIHRGQCRFDDDEPRFCTKEYRPVCARLGDTLRTFGNACEADAAGWRIIDQGRR